MHDATVIIPAYEEDPVAITNLVAELRTIGAEVIVVDDGSAIPYPDSIKHGTNFGYGAALMTGIKNATREIIITADGDNQHRVSEIVKLYHAYKLMGDVDMVIGVRRLKQESLLRYLGRKMLNWTASLCCAYWLPDLNSGCRIFKKSIAIGYFPILCKRFSFTTSLTISMLCDKYRVEFFPIKVEDRHHGKSRVKVVRDGLVTLYYIFRNSFALRTRGLRHWKRNLFSKSI